MAVTSIFFTDLRKFQYGCVHDDSSANSSGFIQGNSNLKIVRIGILEIKSINWSQVEQFKAEPNAVYGL